MATTRVDRPSISPESQGKPELHYRVTYLSRRAFESSCGHHPDGRRIHFYITFAIRGLFVFRMLGLLVD
jgi:hypothetical protein